MTLRHFQIFLKVCDLGGMTRAAESLHISQPSVSQAIRELESHYQARIFERLGKQLFLTAAGKELLHYARHIVGLAAQTESALRSYSAVSPLRIGATLSIGESVFIPILSNLCKKLPRQLIYSRIHNTSILEEQLLKDELDIALVEGKIQSEYLHEIPFLEDELIFIDAPGTAPERTREELEQCPFLTREEGSGTRTLFEQTLASYRITPRLVGIYNNSESIKQAVMAGFGASALSRRIVERELSQGTLTEFSVPGIHFRRDFRIVHHVNKYITPALECFMKICHDYQ